MYNDTYALSEDGGVRPFIYRCLERIPSLGNARAEAIVAVLRDREASEVIRARTFVELTKVYQRYTKLITLAMNRYGGWKREGFESYVTPQRMEAQGG